MNFFQALRGFAHAHPNAQLQPKTTASFARFTVAALIGLSLVTASGCAGKKPAAEEGMTDGAGADVNANALGDSDSGRAMGLQTIHFGYDSFVLEEAEKNLLKSNASILKENAGVRIQIEGHCDQRGGIQYNIALGEKRANAVKKYLQGMGISEDRLTTISYGKERPVDEGETEAAHSKNRRANFAITSQ
jgi:peptidoglycan-associated lipoprotein